jgi:hypothetical protein
MPEHKAVVEEVVDPDTMLDEEDLRCIAHTLKAAKEGKLIPLDKVLEELNVRVRRRAR